MIRQVIYVRNLFHTEAHVELENSFKNFVELHREWTES